MKEVTRIGMDDYDSIVQNLTVPQCKNTKEVKMGYSGTNFFIKGSGGESIWTGSVGPCHAVFIYGSPKSGILGQVGLVHVSGQHDVIVSQAEKLLDTMESLYDCEIFVVGGDAEGYSSGYTLDPDNLGSKLGGKVKLLISPASKDGEYVRAELTGDRHVNIAKHE